ncbi:sigma-54 interaction domain-containing protein [Thiohalorhabdus sp.]|uniref:sigma-54 interaction domain-containing protein n=1 Tax=Thiohalorhabdus sp. TaxID=3094134 RepID=UPI002FC3671F
MPSLPEVSGLLDTYRDPAILLDRGYRIVAANQAYDAFYGGGAPVLNRRCYEVSHGYQVPCDQAGEDCPLKGSLESGGAQRLLHVHHTPAGREHVDVETRPVRDETGEIVLFLELLRPVRSATPEGTKSALVGSSPAFNHMIELVHRVAPTEAAVLLEGESGTGKELVAKALHEESQRAEGPFVPVECSGLTESLFESELFGHEKGAFTGAHYRKMGLVEAARGGTLFLDEVGDIPLPLQVKLLRLLETGTFRAVGSVEVRQTDFRLVCATHQDLSAMVADGRFREDLYYRLATFPIRLPALRERGSDLPVLARRLLERSAQGQGKALGETTLERLSRYPFPGNIRELRNVLERAAILADDGDIRPEHLMGLEREQGRELATGPLPAEILPLDEVTDRYLLWAEARAEAMDRGELARRLGVSERTLYRRLRQARGQGD